MTTYPLTGSRRERLVAWLAFNGVQLQRRKGVDFVRLERKGRGPLKLMLRDDGRTACFVGSRASDRSLKVERLMQDWNQAEMYMPGASHAATIAARLRDSIDGEPDHAVQGMVDFYAARPVFLEQLREDDVRLEVTKAGRVKEHRRPKFHSLTDLVNRLQREQFYRGELARRAAEFEGGSQTVSLPTVAELLDRIAPRVAVQLSLFEAAA